jgi:hypothetical protein
VPPWDFSVDEVDSTGRAGDPLGGSGEWVAADKGSGEWLLLLTSWDSSAAAVAGWGDGGDEATAAEDPETEKRAAEEGSLRRLL